MGIEYESVEQVDTFKYLGCNISMLDEDDSEGTCRSVQRLPSPLEVQLDAVLPHQCHMPQ